MVIKQNLKGNQNPDNYGTLTGIKWLKFGL